MRGNGFVFHCIDLLYYKCYSISLNRGGSHIDSPDLITSKKATQTPKINDNKCFQCAKCFQ